MAEPLRTSDIIFPTQSTNLSSTLAELRRSTLNIGNRFRSISEDATFVCTVADTYGLPLIANERCGSWYIPPERKAGSAYFKSTDGHNGQWAFSLRRLNFQILDTVGSNKGCIIVDSTRRGKRMPDALSKTIPIWCAVLNRVLFPDAKVTNSLRTPPQSVSASEHAQIEQKLQQFVDQFKSLRLNTAALRQQLSKPLRPIWVTRDSLLPQERPIFLDFHPLILCTASRFVPGAEISEAGYIQGAGDDNEGWSQGLDPQIFWSNKEQLLGVVEEDLPNMIGQLLRRHQHTDKLVLPTVIAPTDWLFIASSSALNENSMDRFTRIIFCEKASDRVIDPERAANHLHLHCREGKLGSRDLRKELKKVAKFLVSRLPNERVLVSCYDGKDISVGVALTVLCQFADDNGNLLESIHESACMDKDFIRRRLNWIMTSLPNSKPSRTTLQSVNDFLLTPRKLNSTAPIT